jgi:predicted FMN-binding regulatory protein PaiB
MKRWILLAFVGLAGCNSYVDPNWYNKPAFTEHLVTLYAYPSVPVTPGKE